MSVSSAVESKFSILDIAEQHEAIKKDFFDAFEKLYDSNFSSDESAESEFEIEFAKFCQTRYAVGVNNGTSALHLALLTLNVGAGDEVILPANTHIGAAWAVSYTGATPIFVDCTDDTWQISIHMSEKITSRTKVIIGVHMYGQPCDIRGIKEICRKNKLFFLEDASHANGAKYKNIRVGSFGEMTCFNCCPGHNLGGCGEAGIITTNNKQYYKRLKSLRNNGSVLKYYHDEIGFNMRISEIEATFLNIKLKYLEEWNHRRKQIARRYRSGIRNDKLQFQHQPAWADSVYQLFVITTEDRDHLIHYLNQHEIYPDLHYPVPCHLQKPFRDLNNALGDFPNSEYLASHCLSLPMNVELNEDKVDYLIDVLNNY